MCSDVWGAIHTEHFFPNQADFCWSVWLIHVTNLHVEIFRFQAKFPILKFEDSTQP